MPGRPWPRGEIELIKKIAPDYDTLSRLLPERSVAQIRNMAFRLGVARNHQHITSRESGIIKALWPNTRAIANSLPHLKLDAIRAHGRAVLNLPRIQAKGRPVTNDELQQLRNGACKLEGRTKSSVSYIRAKHDILMRPNWNAAEIAALKVNPYGKIPGRSLEATIKKSRSLGLYLARPSKPNAPAGTIILEAVQRAIPRTLPRQVQQEVLSDLTLSILEGEIELASVAGAVSKAIKVVYKRYPVLGAPVSLDMKLFDDGGTTLGDRITSDVFHF